MSLFDTNRQIAHKIGPANQKQWEELQLRLEGYVQEFDKIFQSNITCHLAVQRLESLLQRINVDKQKTLKHLYDKLPENYSSKKHKLTPAQVRALEHIEQITNCYRTFTGHFDDLVYKLRSA